MRDNLFENVFVSVGITFEYRLDGCLLRSLGKFCANQFVFYEIIAAVNPSLIDAEVEQEILTIPNMRVVILNDTASEAILREKILEQAIGDFIMLFEPYEADFSVIPTLLALNIKGNDFTSLLYDDKFSTYSHFSNFYHKIIGKLTGYLIDSHISGTCCFSRSLVTAIINQKIGQNNLRLLIASMGFRHAYVNGAKRQPNSLHEILKKLNASLDILGSVPQKLLQFTSWLLLSCCIGNVLYATYAAGVWIFNPKV